MAMVVDADTHIGEPAAMWEHFDKELYGRRPVVVKVPNDTWYGRRNYVELDPLTRPAHIFRIRRFD